MDKERWRAEFYAVIEASRRLVAAADEFLPDYPQAIPEHFDALIDAIAKLATD